MRTAELKLEIFRFIDNLDSTKLHKVYDLLVKNQTSKKDFWEELNEWQKNDIEKGIQDLDNNEKFDFDKVLQKYK